MPATKSGGGFEGYVWVTPHGIADELMTKEGRPPELRLLFKADPQEGEEQIVYLGVPLTMEAGTKLAPWIGSGADVPTDEQGLRSLIANRMTGEKVYVRVWNNFIQEVPCPLGKHRGTLTSLRKFTRRADGENRMTFELTTTDGMTTTWTARYSPVGKKIGNGEKDELALNPRSFDMVYLGKLGLDLDRFIKECNEYQAKDGRLFTRIGLDGEEKGMFASHEDITPELLEAVHRHGVQVVEINIVKVQGYNPGPERQGQFKEVILTPVIIEGSAGPSQDELEFVKERDRFVAAVELVMTTVYAKPMRFAAAGKMTDDGKEFAKIAIKPLVASHPAITKVKTSDGQPGIHPVLSSDNWTTDGLVALGMVFEKAMAAEELELDIPFDGAMDSKVLRGEEPPTKFLEWAEANVPELKFDPDLSGKEELL